MLEGILQPLKLKYEVSGDKIILKRQLNTSEAEPQILPTPDAPAAEINLTGTVTDTDGMGLPGVSILVKERKRVPPPTEPVNSGSMWPTVVRCLFSVLSDTFHRKSR